MLGAILIFYMVMGVTLCIWLPLAVPTDCNGYDDLPNIIIDDIDVEAVKTLLETKI